MANGGFIIRFNGEVITHCYNVSFDYDHWHYSVNNETPKELPADLEAIGIEVEEE